MGSLSHFCRSDSLQVFMNKSLILFLRKEQKNVAVEEENGSQSHNSLPGHITR